MTEHTGMGDELSPFADIVEALRHLAKGGAGPVNAICAKAANAIEAYRKTTGAHLDQKLAAALTRSADPNAGSIAGACTLTDEQIAAMRPADPLPGEKGELPARLRAWPFESGDPVNAETSFALIKEAADEIERLRSERDGYKAGFNLKSEECARLSEQLVKARAALRPFVSKMQAMEDDYRKRGGDPDIFPDTHPSFNVEAHVLPIGIWRAARAALTDD